jgi:hypothetical protein
MAMMTVLSSTLFDLAIFLINLYGFTQLEVMMGEGPGHNIFMTMYIVCKLADQLYILAGESHKTPWSVGRQPWGL